MSAILVVEKNTGRLEKMQNTLRQSEHYFMMAEDSKSATQMLSKLHFDAVLFGLDSMEEKPESWVKKLKTRYPRTAFFVINTSQTKEITDNGIKDIVDGFLDYPLQVIEFNSNLETAQNRQQIEGELNYLRHEQGLVHHFEDIKGSSQRFKALIQEVKKVINTDATVLILGETGTGKELIAGAIHHSGPRKGKPFIKVNCAALPETLLESELFGHEKGSFTGAHKQRIGRIEQANGGTLFLDEIAEMSLGMQSKLLRVLQQREFERVGGTQTIRVDIRLIAATNKELREAISGGSFREDLFYRLNVFPIQMPSLRERKEDILLLADYFIKKYCAQYAKKVQGIAGNAKRTMMEYPWPGNVRELENAIERAVLLVDPDSEISPKELGLPAGMSSLSHKSLSIKLPPEGISIKDVEKELIIQALEMTGWVQKDAARLLGMSKRAMNYRIQQYRITHTGWAKNKESVHNEK